MQNDYHTHSKQLLRLPAVIALTGMQKSFIYAQIKSGNFPRPVKMGAVSAFVADEINDWIERQVKARDTQITERAA